MFGFMVVNKAKKAASKMAIDEIVKTAVSAVYPYETSKAREQYLRMKGSWNLREAAKATYSWEIKDILNGIEGSQKLDARLAEKFLTAIGNTSICEQPVYTTTYDSVGCYGSDERIVMLAAQKLQRYNVIKNVFEAKKILEEHFGGFASFAKQWSTPCSNVDGMITPNTYDKAARSLLPQNVYDLMLNGELSVVRSYQIRDRSYVQVSDGLCDGSYVYDKDQQMWLWSDCYRRASLPEKLSWEMEKSAESRGSYMKYASKLF